MVSIFNGISMPMKNGTPVKPADLQKQSVLYRSLLEYILHFSPKAPAMITCGASLIDIVGYLIFGNLAKEIHYLSIETINPNQPIGKCKNK